MDHRPAPSIGPTGERVFDRVDAGLSVVCVPSVSLIELDEAMADGDVTLSEPFPTFVRRLTATPSRYAVIDLTPEIVLRAHELLQIPERGDRLIAATAAVLDYPLISRDREIPAGAGIDLIW